MYLLYLLTKTDLTPLCHLPTTDLFSYPGISPITTTTTKSSCQQFKRLITRIGIHIKKHNHFFVFLASSKQNLPWTSNQQTTKAIKEETSIPHRHLNHHSKPRKWIFLSLQRNSFRPYADQTHSCTIPSNR